MATTGNHAALVIRGRTVLVDAEDADKVSRLPWTFFDDKRGHVYAQVQIKGVDDKWRQVRLHRMLMGCTPKDGRVVDHINGNTLDNRKANLRVVNHTKNTQNRSRRKHGGPVKTGSGWIVRLMRDGRLHYFGFYRSHEQAASVFASALEKVDAN